MFLIGILAPHKYWTQFTTSEVVNVERYLVFNIVLFSTGEYRPIIKAIMAFSDPEQNIAQFNLPEGGHVADFGVGSGAYAFAAAKRVGSEGRVYAVDIQKPLLQKVKNEGLRQHIANIQILWGDVEHPGGTQLKDGSMDAVMATNILFQLGDKNAFVEEVKRVLHPKGKVLVVDWSGSFGGMGPAERDVVSKETAQKFFLDKGFTLEKEIEAGDHHYGFIFRKQ